MLASRGALPWASHSRHQESVGATPCPWCSPRAEPTDMTRAPSPGPGSQVAEIWRVSNVPGPPNPSEAGWGWEGPLLLFPGPHWLPGPLAQPVWFPGRQGPRGSRQVLAGLLWPSPRPGATIMTIGGQRSVCPLPSNNFLNHIFQPLGYKGKYNSQQSSFVFFPPF